MVQVVSNVTAAELARRLEKEGVVVVSFFAGASCSAVWLLPAASAALLCCCSSRHSAAVAAPAQTLPCCHCPALLGYESACRAPLNQLNAAVHGLHGLATGVQVGGSLLRSQAHPLLHDLCGDCCLGATASCRCGCFTRLLRATCMSA